MKKLEKNMTIDRLAEVMFKRFDDIENRMATKKDLEKMATKKDLEKLATKVDLEDLASMTARGFEVVVSKDEFKKAFTHLEGRIDDLDLRISSYATSSNNHFGRLNDWVGELDLRVNKIENKASSK